MKKAKENKDDLNNAVEEVKSKVNAVVSNKNEITKHMQNMQNTEDLKLQPAGKTSPGHPDFGYTSLYRA